MSPAEAPTVRIGVISDTHKVLPKAAVAALGGVDAVLHAGDIGSPEVLWELMGVAPVTAVRGNTDHEMPGFDLAAVARVPIGGKRVLVVHDIKTLGPVPPGVDIVAYGHTHRAHVACRDGVLFVNPGSASRARDEGESVAIVEVTPEGETSAQIVRL